MTALAPFPKWDLCQFLVKKFLCCKKHCHSWLQWARQKPKTWRLRNLLGNLPGKEKKLLYSKPKKKHWVCLAHLLTPAVRAASCFKLHIWGRTPARAGEHHVPTVPPLHPWCWLASSHHLRTDTWLTAILLSCWLPGTTRANLPLFVKRAIWNTIQRDLKKGFDLSFQAWTRRFCQHRLFSMISMIDIPARNTILAVLVHICHRHLLFVGMNMYYKKTRFKGKKRASPTF